MSQSKNNRLNRRNFIGLSTMAGAGLLLGCSKEETFPKEFSETYTQALVIGTGFGGAVTALRLGEAGIQVTMLERGQRWNITPEYNTFSNYLIPDKRSTWLRRRSVPPIGPKIRISKYTGVLERIKYPNMKVYNGAGVGGGSLVYGGITIQPEESLFNQVFPSEIDYGQMNDLYYPRVREMLDAQPIPSDLFEESEYFQYSRVGKAHAENIGLETEFFPSTFDWDKIRQEMNGELPEAAIIGETIYGVNSGAKKSLDTNYLPAAEATGNVTIHALHQVADIKQNDSGQYIVEVEVLNEDGIAIAQKTFTTDYLFMAAGSTGSTRLLMRAREKGNLPNLPESIGQGWGSNGATMIARSFLRESTGTKQSSPSNCAVKDFANAVAPTLLDMANFPTGIDTRSLIALGLSLVEDRGHFTYDPVKDDVMLQWSNTASNKAKEAIENLTNRLNAANGGFRGSLLIPQTIKDLTYHPLGGVVMGEAADYCGRVEGYNNLYIMDGAFIPGSTACANPSLTIAALAERNIEKILGNDFFGS